MIKVKLYRGQPIESGLKKLRKQLQKEELFQELFERRYYKSKGLIRKERLKKARYLNQFTNID